MTIQDDETDDEIRKTKSALANLKGSGKGGGAKASSFKPPRVGKVPGLSGGKGGGHGGGKVFHGKPKAPHTAPAPKPIAAQRKVMAGSAGGAKNPGEPRRYVPVGGRSKSGPRKSGLR
jgi:hypothetical protein